MKLDLALVHYPVRNRNGETICSAVTNLDLHDIARVGRTYGVGRFYVVTPLHDQQRLVADIIDHWRNGYGAASNPHRREAFSLITVVDRLESLVRRLADEDDGSPRIVATSAAARGRAVTYGRVREFLARDERVLLLFGTASGLAPEVFDGVDGVLPPLGGVGEYNHLSVRSAVSIILDRLIGRDQDGNGQ